MLPQSIIELIEKNAEAYGSQFQAFPNVNIHEARVKAYEQAASLWIERMLPWPGWLKSNYVAVYDEVKDESMYVDVLKYEAGERQGKSRNEVLGEFIKQFVKY